MARFFSVHDPHFRTTTPERRRDADYLETLLGKWQYILAQAQKKNVDAILVPGDLLHGPNQTPRMRNRFMRLQNEYQIETIMCLGNHDVSQRKRGHLYADESDIGTFAEAGVLRVLTNGASWEFGNVSIMGYGDGEPETQDLLDGLYVRPKKDKMFRIALIHAAYGGTAEKMGRGKCIETCKIKGVDIALFGDIHDDPWHGYKHRTGVVSYNPGSMVRMNKDERDREVAYLDIDVKSDKGADGEWVFTVDRCTIPILSPESVFDTEGIRREIAEAAQNFQAAIAVAKASKSEDPEKMLFRVASESAFDKSVAECAVQHLPKDYEL